MGSARQRESGLSSLSVGERSRLKGSEAESGPRGSRDLKSGPGRGGGPRLERWKLNFGSDCEDQCTDQVRVLRAWV